jgi:hypothetical protein
MAVNMERMREKRNRDDYFKPKEGKTLVYVAGPCRPDYDLPMVDVHIHFGFGQDNGAVACLDQERNAALRDREVLRRLLPYLEKVGIDVSAGCAPCEHVAEFNRRVAGVNLDKLDPEERDRWKKEIELWREREARLQHLFNVIAMKHRDVGRSGWNPLTPRLEPYMVGKKVYDGILSCFDDLGDITNPASATLVQIERTGQKLKTTYSVSSDVETVRSPLALSKDLRTMLADALVENGAGDLFAIVARKFRPRSRIEAMLRGLAVADDGEGDGGAAGGEAEEEGPAKPAASTARGRAVDVAEEEEPAPRSAARAAAPAQDQERPAARAQAEPAAPARAAAPEEPNESNCTKRCYKRDADAGDPECQACAWRFWCAPECGLVVDDGGRIISKRAAARAAEAAQGVAAAPASAPVAAAQAAPARAATPNAEDQDMERLKSLIGRKPSAAAPKE